MSLGPRITFFRNCVPPSSLHCKDLCNQWVPIIEHELRSSINVPASALLRTWVSKNYPEFQEQVPQVPWDTQPVQRVSGSDVCVSISEFSDSALVSSCNDSLVPLPLPPFRVLRVSQQWGAECFEDICCHTSRNTQKSPVLSVLYCLGYPPRDSRQSLQCLQKRCFYIGHIDSFICPATHQ